MLMVTVYLIPSKNWLFDYLGLVRIKVRTTFFFLENMLCNSGTIATFSVIIKHYYTSMWLFFCIINSSIHLFLQVDNFVHADLHPGNMLVRAQTKHSNKRLFKSKPHVIFLDVGMTAELSSSDRVNLLNFFKAVALRDGRTAAECTLRLSRNQNCSNPKAFIEVLSVVASFSEWPD